MYKTLSYALGALSLVAGSFTTATAQNADVPTIYGSVVYATGWQDMKDAPYGVYAIDGGNTAEPRAVKIDEKIHASGGGVYIDGLYHLVDYAILDDGLSVALRTYDVQNDWRLVRERYLDNTGSIASDLTYDPTSDLIYGCFGRGTDELNKTYVLGTLDEYTGQANEIATLSEKLLTLACNREGELFGISEFGKLYRINKENAVMTLVGSTGKNIKYDQSMTFDYATGRLFWAATSHGTDNPVHLYEVNTADGTCTSFGEIYKRYEFTGIFTESPFTTAAEPGRIANLRADFPAGALTGNLRFSAPSTTFGGTALSGALSYRVRVDGEEYATGTCTAGGAVSVPATLTAGAHLVKVNVTNGTGRSPVAVQEYWAGPDTPVAGNVQAVKGADGRVTLTWSAAKGVHDGYVDASNITYRVVRKPDNVQIYNGSELTCTETSAVSRYGSYTYEVTAYTGTVKGATATSEPVILGNAVKVPYAESFNTEDALRTYTIEDANADEYTWYYDEGAVCYAYSEDEKDADDWLITPPFNLDPDMLYSLELDVESAFGGTETIRVATGRSPKAADMTHEVLPATQIGSAESRTERVLFRPEAADGATFIGIQAASTYQDGYLLTLDRIALNEVASVFAPVAVTDLQVTPDAKGALSAVVTLTVPTKAIDGSDLTEDCEVDILRGNAAVAALQNVRPGQAVTFTDTPPLPGNYTYTVVVVGNYGEGLSAEATVYVGEDVPDVPGNIRLQEETPGRLVLTWTAPERGSHGGYINPDNVKYEVTNSAGATETVEGLRYETEVSVPTDKQQLHQFQIRSRSSRGRGTVVPSNTIFVGEGYELPFKESFSYRSFDREPWNNELGEGAEWNILPYALYADPQDADGGMYLHMANTEGAVSHLTSPKLTLSGKHPTLRFWMNHQPKALHEVEVRILRADGTAEVLERIRENDLVDNHPHGAWFQHTYNLEQYLGKGDIQLDLQFEDRLSPELVNSLYIDNIRVYDWLDHNLEMVSMTNRETSVQVGDSVHFDVTVSNNGSQTAQGYNLVLYRDNQVVSTLAGTPVAADSTATFTLFDRPNADAKESSRYHVAVEWKQDEVADDNRSAAVTVTVLPGLPFVDRVTAGVEGTSITLDWAAPQISTADQTEETVTEDFESYTPFTITNVGRWTLVDGDGRQTLGIQNGQGDYIEYDNVGKPMAYQVFRPSAIGLNNVWTPYSGSQVLAAFSCGRYCPNDDWLISPEVKGGQTVTFHAKSPDNTEFDTNETIQVLYSTGSTDTKDFIQIGSDITVPGGWMEMKFDLPADARRFAIRCVSDDQYILFLDDITYTRAASGVSLMGYNVYRDGKRMNEALVTATHYVDATPANDWHEYTVTAVYNEGESVPSEAVRASVTGIDDVLNAARPAFTAGRGYIRVFPSESTVRIIDLAGRVRYEGRAGAVVRLAPGVYLVNGERVLVM